MSYTDVHILNVGAGACTVVEHPSGHLSMVDINDGGELRDYEKQALSKRGPAGFLKLMREQAALTDPIEWFRGTYPGRSVHRFILSHPDADHMAGIRRILKQGELELINFWDTPHHRTRTRGDCKTEAAWQDWLAYRQFRNGEQLAGVTWPKKLNPLRGDSRDYWNIDQIQILSPTLSLVERADKAEKYNDASYVLRLVHADSLMMLPGDVEEFGWHDMLDAGIPLGAHVLVASHHGRRSGYDEDAIAAIRPQVVIVSTGELPPEHDAVPMYRRHAEHVFSTREEGNIRVLMTDDGRISIWNQAGHLLVRYGRSAA